MCVIEYVARNGREGFMDAHVAAFGGTEIGVHARRGEELPRFATGRVIEAKLVEEGLGLWLRIELPDDALTLSTDAMTRPFGQPVRLAGLRVAEGDD